MSHVAEIRRLRAQMLVHSYLYYVLDDPIWTDERWQEAANKLRDLQAAHPELIGFYDEQFVGWDGSSGYHLPRDGWTTNKALYVRRLVDGFEPSQDAADPEPVQFDLFGGAP